MYWKSSGKNIRVLDEFGLHTKQSISSIGGKEEFYELELGVVLDIVLDENHPIFSKEKFLHTSIDIDRWPSDFKGNKPSFKDKDLTWIGKILVRPISSEKNTRKDELIWASPLESNISEYPLVNETVVLVRYLDKLFYTRKVNLKNWPHNSLDFGLELSISGVKNTEIYSNPLEEYKGVKSLTKHKGGTNYEGVAGRYYKTNNNIRTLKRFEGDFLLESRFGQSIHFLSFDSNRENDKGDPKNKDYVDSGNPMILIRNRQRPLVSEGQRLYPHKKLPPITGTPQEKNVGGYLEENINHDGTSIHMTSGMTISKYVTSCYKKMFGLGEEVSSFDSDYKTSFPILNGDQIVINSDRIIISSRYNETFHFSKNRYSVVTDNKYSVDAHEQVSISTNTGTTINSPYIFLGESNVTDEPALLGQTTVNWMYELCNWLIEHTHWYIHSHVDAGEESPSQTQLPVQLEKLKQLRDRLHSLMSRRVFLTGGGLAPGKNGENITDGAPPTNINIFDGNGVPGGWKSSNYRK